VDSYYFKKFTYFLELKILNVSAYTLWHTKLKMTYVAEYFIFAPKVPTHQRI